MVERLTAIHVMFTAECKVAAARRAGGAGGWRKAQAVVECSFLLLWAQRMRSQGSSTCQNGCKVTVASPVEEQVSPSLSMAASGGRGKVYVVCSIRCSRQGVNRRNLHTEIIQSWQKVNEEQ